MAKKRSQPRAVLSPAARGDIREILKWSEKKFGQEATLRYEMLLVQAMRDIEADAERPESQRRDELAQGVLVYPIRFSRQRARSALGAVHNPRHLIVYRLHDRKVIDILRILHDARDLQRHLPEEHRSKSAAEE